MCRLFLHNCTQALICSAQQASNLELLMTANSTATRNEKLMRFIASHQFLFYPLWKHMKGQKMLVFLKIFAIVHLPACCLTYCPFYLFNKQSIHCLV